LTCHLCERYNLTMPKKKITTIEDLAGMIQKEFLDLHKKIDDGFENLSSRITSLDNRISALEDDMRFVRATLTDLDNRLESIEEFDEEIIERLGRIEQLVDEDQQTRIKRLEDSMQRVYEQLAIK